MKTVTIIGGGIGGLFTGAFLSKNNCKVTIIEKNKIIGGGLQCFHRDGKIFETGMHVMGGFQEGGSLNKICAYLGILDKLTLNHMDDDCMDEINYPSHGITYKIATGRENFINSISSYFPHESENIRRYVDELYNLTEEVPLFYLKESPGNLIVHSDKFLWAVGDFINFYVTDSRLRELLAYLNPLYGGVFDGTPAYIHALINVLYINGACRFVGGSQQLANSLVDVIENNGGCVINNTAVTNVNVKDHNVTDVVTENGISYKSDYYISAIHPVSLINIITPGAFPKAYTSRLNTVPNSYSAFSLFIDLKPQSVKYINHTCYFLQDYGMMWNQAEYDEANWPSGFMYMTPPDINQGEYASRMLVHCIMSYNQVKQWENTFAMHRGQSYIDWKDNHINKILNKLENFIPKIRSSIKNVYSASPLTIRDYYNTKEGSIFGFRKDCRNFVYSQLPINTKVKNLYLTGQNNNLHGICGVPLTAINTAEAILGVNTIVRAINQNVSKKINE